MSTRRRSSFSSTDSEQFTPKHKYNTRLSAKLKEDIYKPISYEIIEEECSSADSRKFSLQSCDLPEKDLCISDIEKKLIILKESMDERECRPTRGRYEGIWKIITFGAVGLILYGIVNHVHNDLRRIGKDITYLKSKMRDLQDNRLDFEYKIGKLDNVLNDMKNGQAMLLDQSSKVVDEKIDLLYADKTGKTDYALESAGGRIVHISPGTQNYGDHKSSIFGLSLCEGSHGPRAIIQAWISPGSCWALKGSNGGVVIKLLGRVKIDSVSLEHIPKSISPSRDSKTAPNDFAVWGMSNPADRGVPLGQWSYNINGKPVQTFDLEKPSPAGFDYVELKILSNHGHPDYTCVYRFRVHGTLDER